MSSQIQANFDGKPHRDNIWARCPENRARTELDCSPSGQLVAAGFGPGVPSLRPLFAGQDLHVPSPRRPARRRRVRGTPMSAPDVQGVLSAVRVGREDSRTAPEGTSLRGGPGRQAAPSVTAPAAGRGRSGPHGLPRPPSPAPLGPAGHRGLHRCLVTREAARIAVPVSSAVPAWSPP